jgi:hypothetical protein
VRRPGDSGDTWNWREPRGPKNTAGIGAPYEVMGMREMLSTYHRTDAHFIPYLVLGADGKMMERQPRVLKTALPWMVDQGHRIVASVLIVDVDNPGKNGWNDDDRERVAVEHACVPLLQTVGVYSTRNGRRLIQPLDRELDVETFERVVRAYLLSLDEAGVIGVDHKCSDWTRHYRVARCMRKGLYEPPWLEDLSKMRPIAPPEPVAAIPRQRKAAQGTASYREALDPKWTVDLPPVYRQLVAEFSDVLVTVQSQWHDVFLALSGALLERRVPPEHVPAVVTAVSIETQADTAADGRYKAAQTTVRRWQCNEPFKGFNALQKIDPRLAAVLRRHTATEPEQRVASQIEAARDNAAPVSPVEIASIGIERTIEGAYGLVAIEAGCGIGKSQAALRVAVKRAAKRPKSEDAMTDRAPSGSKTAISVPTHQLAIQHTENLRKRGAKVTRVFGPLSVYKPDGTPECHYHEQGKALAGGGQSVAWEFCQGRGKRRCDYWETCKARDGIDADESARIIVGTHQKIASISEAIGDSGLLIIDEPPDPVVDAAFTLRDVDAYLDCENDFVPEYWTTTYPLVLAVRAALQGDVVTRSDEAHSAAAVLGIGWHAVPEAVVRECLDRAGDVAPLQGTDTLARVFAAQPMALNADAKGDAPRLRRHAVYQARDLAAVATRVGKASAVVHALWRAATQQPPASLRITNVKGTRTLVVSLIERDYIMALQRGIPTVLLDADLTLQHAIAERVLKAPVPKHCFVAPDGAKVTRELWLEPKARRAHWLTSDAKDERWPVWEVGPLRAIQCIADEARLRGLHSIAIITVLPLAKCLRVVLGEPGEHGVPRDIADEAVRLVVPVLASAPGVAWKVGHYGAMRGLDSMMECDGLVTLMDPIPDIGLRQHRAAYYAFKIPWERYVEIVTAAEIEQAHGRLRHPHRIAPAWCAHVGSTLPRGYGWDSPDVAVLRTRLRQVATCMGPEELLAIKGPRTTKAFARAVGIRDDTMSRYLNGSRPVPRDVAASLRKYAAKFSKS